jgi:uncharacterized membrane protein
MKEPLSTVSNLAFAVAGVAVALQETAVAIYAGLCLCFLCYGSWMYHKTGLSFHQRLDEIAMYWAFNSIIAFKLFALFGNAPAAILLAVTASVLMTRAWDILSSFTWVPALVIIAIVLDGLDSGWTQALYVLITFLIAVVFRTIGKRLSQRESDPKDAVRIDDLYHGILWHPIAALAMYFILS